MKNYMKEVEKAAKVIAKEDNLFIQKTNDEVYICSGYYIIKVSEALYNAVFRISSPRFVDLTEDTTYVSRDKKALPEKSATGPDIKSFVTKEKDYQPAEVTPYKMEVPNQIADLRIIFVGGEQVRIRNDWFEKFSIFGTGTLYGRNRKNPVFTDFDEDTAFLILPVHYIAGNETEGSRFEVIDTETAAKINAA